MRPSPVTILMTPSGKPARRQSSPSTSVVSGVSSCGLITAVFPVTSEGPTLRAKVRRAGRNWDVSLLDLSFGPEVDPDLDLTIEAYRRWARGLG